MESRKAVAEAEHSNGGSASERGWARRAQEVQKGTSLRRRRQPRADKGPHPHPARGARPGHSLCLTERGQGTLLRRRAGFSQRCPHGEQQVVGCS